MEISKDTSIGEAVKFNYKAVSFLQAYAIDLCCGGTKTISEAGRKAGVSGFEFEVGIYKIN